jgi:hypothetical protein
VATDINSARKRAAIITSVVGGAFVLVSLFLWWWFRLPQLGGNEEVTNTVDALFTAVTARDEKLLAECKQQLLKLKDEDKLPTEASAYLENIIGNARADRWASAARSLYDFMRAQRRTLRVAAHE